MPEGENEVEGEKEQSGKREKPVVRPEEIPPVPENRFLLRRDMPPQEDKTEMSVLSWASFIWRFLEHILAYTLNTKVLTAGVYFDVIFSELRKKKRLFQPTRNQQSPSLDGRSKAEEQWYAHLRSEICLFRFGVDVLIVLVVDPL